MDLSDLPSATNQKVTEPKFKQMYKIDTVFLSLLKAVFTIGK